MKRNYLVVLCSIFFTNSFAQNVGIGTANPLTQLHIKGGLLLDSTNGTTPVSGNGTRLMWIPAKGAFRAGSVIFGVPSWDDVNIGLNSFAIGTNTEASGSYSTAMGYSTKAIGDFSTAIGNDNSASGYNSVAMGLVTTASGDFSLATGYNSSSSATGATAMGNSTKAKNFFATVIGTYNDSATVGIALAISPTNRLFQIGNGTGDNARSNAMTVLANGNVGIGVLNPTQMLEVAANITVQNGKGLIRTIDGTQQKKLSTTVVVNTTLSAGASTAIGFTFPESFSSTPDVYVGNVISGAGGWAEVIMTISNVTTTGGQLYINNPRTSSWSPNYTVKIVAIGPQ